MSREQTYGQKNSSLCPLRVLKCYISSLRPFSFTAQEQIPSVSLKLKEENMYHKLKLKSVHIPLHFKIFNVTRKGKKLLDISFRRSQGDIADLDSLNLHTEQNKHFDQEIFQGCSQETTEINKQQL